MKWYTNILAILLILAPFVLGYSNVPGGQFAISAVINIITVVILMIFVMLFNRWSKAGEGVTYA